MRHVVSIAVVMVLLAGGLLARGVTAQGATLQDLLPAAADVGPGFVVVDERVRTLGEQAAAFANADDAAQRLAEWGWQENVFAVFQTAELTAAGAPAVTLDISLTRFADAEGAALALPYFLADRAAVLGQRETPVPAAVPIGDEARAVNGAVEGGAFDFTLYVRSGPLLLRISATAASGAPHASPEQIARGIINRAAGLWQPAVTSTTMAAYLPDALELANVSCGRVDSDAGLDVPAMMERFDGVSDAAATLVAMGWLDGAHRQFGCDDPPPGGVGWVNINVLHFTDAAAAADAVSAFAKSRAVVTGLRPVEAIDLGESAAALTGPTVNGTEHTLFMSSGPLLFRITGVAPTGDPRQDVEGIAAALYTQSLSLGLPSAEPLVPTPFAVPEAAATLSPPTVAPLPTPIPVPTVTPVPTATATPPTPVATATATPPPTVPPTATPDEPPALIPVEIPTATAPQPTAPTGPLPTPTPRVIRPPTPAAG